MEPTAEFNLEQAISQWIACMRSKRPFRPDDLEELKGHLFDQTEDWISKGLCPEQAFQRTLVQMGEPDYLVAEYRKVNGWYIWRQRALAASQLAITSKRVAAFSLLFVVITFSSIFGQKPQEKRWESNTSPQPVQPVCPKDSLPESFRPYNSLNQE